MRTRTSESSPIQVALLDAPSLPGKIGMTFAPGKHQNGMTANWRRDLDADLLRLREEFKASVLVCLLEEHELTAVKIKQLPDEATQHGIEFWHFPIPDTGVPSDLEASADLVARIHGALENGETVVIHCMGGLGRTGTIAAACLVGLGENSEAAIHEVRSARPGAIENELQKDFVTTFGNVWWNHKRESSR
jgi:protein-tyrosine phosphatase